jgi:stage II sporulation protein D
MTKFVILVAALVFFPVFHGYPGEDRLAEANRLFWTGEYEEAARLYRERAGDPGMRIAAGIQLGALYRSMGDYASAIAQYEELLDDASAAASSPDHLRDILIPLAESYLYQRRLQEAERAFTTAAGFAPDAPDLLFDLGRALFARGKLEEAHDAFTKAAALDPGFAGNFVFLARIAHEKNNVQEAASAYRSALRIDPQQAELLYWLGRELQAAGSYEDAFRQYHRLSAIDADNSIVLARIEEVKPSLTRTEDEIIPPKSLERFAPVRAVQDRENIPLLRIGLNTIHRGSIVPLNTLSFVSSGRFRITAVGETVFEGDPGVEYRIALSEAVVSIREADRNVSAGSETKPRTAPGEGDAVRLPASFSIEPVAGEGTSFIIKRIEYARGFTWSGVEDRQYRGRFEVTVIGGGFRLVNEVNLEEYLYSVVPSEMMISYPDEALKAQAVIARSYALYRARYVKPHWEDGFDLCDSQHCQVYKGASNEWPKSTRAVEETRGLVLWADGKVASPFYHANCGGHTQSSSDLAGWGDYDYLAGVLDAPESVEFPASPAGLESWLKTRPPAYCSSRSPEYRWFRIVPAPFLEEKLNRYASIGRLTGLTVAGRSPSGHVRSVLVHGTERTLEIEKEHEIRRFLGLGPLRSTLFWLETMYGDSGAPEEFYIYGGGWGHGVGMCQNGAGGMGALGYGYEQILNHYYPHSTVEKLDY